MPSSPLSVVVEQLRVVARRDGSGRSDGELLSQFLNRRDGDALAVLVERHAPMVWGVCRRILRNPHDAEDAFQATFLVLVQKAATVMPREMVANWLHGVAQQTAVRLRSTGAKRGWREVQLDVMPEPIVAEARDEELLSRLDEELGRLPERFRALIVLCDLEGHTRKEVARKLGCPEGTVASGLVRARELLAKRLTRRGLVVSGGSLAASLSHSVASADVMASVVTSAINVATQVVAGKGAGVISGPVATLTQGVLKTMFLKKIMTTAAVALAVGVAVIAGGSLAVGQTVGKPTPGKEVKDPVGEQPVEPVLSTLRHTTREVEFEVKAGGEKGLPEQKEASTAWGKEIGGLQVGVTVVPGGERQYKPGDRVAFEVKVRNVGKVAVTITYSRPGEHSPEIRDSFGRQVRVTLPPPLDYYAPAIKRVLLPGETMTLVKNEVAVEAMNLEKTIGPEKQITTPTIHVDPGRYTILIGGIVQSHPKLSTGSVEFVVKPALDIPPNPKRDMKKVYTPDELLREKYDAMATRTVEFKVVALAKPTEVKQSPEKESPWVIGHSPDDVSLLPHPPKKFEEEQFATILSSKVVDQMKRIGIKDVAKHFVGKTVRVSGRIRQHNYSGDDPPVAPHSFLVIEDLNQIEAVK